jgi:hypothetical protein
MSIAASGVFTFTQTKVRATSAMVAQGFSLWRNVAAGFRPERMVVS